MKIPKKEVFDYSEKFKKRVILDIVRNHLDCYAVVRKYWGVESKRDVDRYRSTVRRWVRCYQGKGGPTVAAKKVKDIPAGEKNLDKQPPKTMKELLEENLRLRMEVEYLKKVQALVRAEEEAAQRRRKSSRN